MQKLSIILVCGLLFWTASCSSYDVRFDYDRQEDFSIFKTFDFMPIPEELRAESNDLIINRIKSAVTREMTAKGFQHSDSSDLLVAIHTEDKDKFDVTEWGYHYAPYDYYWRDYGYWGGRNIDLIEYEEGTLTIDIIKADEREMIWRGAVTKALPARTSQDKIDQIINTAVKRILENFPPI